MDDIIKCKTRKETEAYYEALVKEGYTVAYGNKVNTIVVVGGLKQEPKPKEGEPHEA